MGSVDPVQLLVDKANGQCVFQGTWYYLVNLVLAYTGVPRPQVGGRGGPVTANWPPAWAPSGPEV